MKAKLRFLRSLNPSRNSGRKVLPKNSQTTVRFESDSQVLPLNQATTLLPTSYECIVHLRFLASLANLRHEISESEDLFLSSATVVPDGFSTDPSRTIQDKRWTIFIARAVRRFEKWLVAVLPENQNGLTPHLRVLTCQTAGKLESILHDTTPFVWATNLPPLDVLMVLHSYMLNPRVFLEDALRLAMVPIWKAGFPWKLIDLYTNKRTFEYLPTLELQQQFETATQLAWDSKEHNENLLASCIACQSDVDSFCQLQQPFPLDTQWLWDAKFPILCTLPCKNVNHLAQMQLHRFQVAVKAVEDDDIALGGTILSRNGLAVSAKSPAESEMTFPNKLVTARRGSNWVEAWCLQRAADNKTTGSSISDLLVEFEEDVIRDTGFATISENERLALSRMKSRYDEGISAFGLELTTAVLRQGKFIVAMEEIDFIHSPALSSTVSIILEKYTVFIEIMRLNKENQIAVPTLAIDLAWHTHQLSPTGYYSFCLQQVNNALINHDDRIEDADLTTAFNCTQEQFTRLTDGLEYSECLCWYCVLLQDRLDQFEIETDRTKDPTLSKEEEARIHLQIQSEIKHVQAAKFQEDFQRAGKRKNMDSNSFLETYSWKFPQFAPDKAMLTLR